MTITTMLRHAALVASICCTPMLAACGVLDVSDPTKIEEKDLQNASSANLLRKDALLQMTMATAHSSRAVALFSDEVTLDPDPYSYGISFEEGFDRRWKAYANDFMAYDNPYAYWVLTRRSTSIALTQIRTYMTEPARSAYAMQMYAVRGFATLRMAEDYCQGFPIHELDGFKLVIGNPTTTTQALERALADFDSALAFTTDSTRIVSFARVGRARTLLALGRFDEAATDAAAVPTSFRYETQQSETYPNRMSWDYDLGYNARLSVGEHDGDSGLNFVSAADPRVPTHAAGPSYDGARTDYAMDKYPTSVEPILIASGIEARLIEAEAALRNDQIAQWRTLLNDLRTMPDGPGLSDTTDPGTDDARTDLLFRERAFWLYGTGHRLTDLRRLVEFYNRAPDTVYPNGAYHLGGTYDAGLSMPFPLRDEAAYNSVVTGCTDQ